MVRWLRAPIPGSVCGTWHGFRTPIVPGPVPRCMQDATTQTPDAIVTVVSGLCLEPEVLARRAELTAVSRSQFHDLDLESRVAAIVESCVGDGESSSESDSSESDAESSCDSLGSPRFLGYPVHAQSSSIQYQ